MDLRDNLRRQPAPRAAAAPPSQQTPAAPAHHKKSKSRGSWALITIIVLAILIIAGTGCFMMMQQSPAKTIEKGKYQAVFLAGGQVYFGHITKVTHDYFKLNNIYYIQSQNQSLQNSTQQSQQQASLTKLGNEVHGPEDSMYIDRHQILFWENLKDDGKVVQAINSSKK